MFYVPGVTAAKLPPGKSFPFRDALAAAGREKPNNDQDQQPGPDSLTTESLVEAVDIYATLSDLAGLDVPPTCPPDPFRVSFCTEGYSFAPLILNVRTTSPVKPSKTAKTGAVQWKKAVFSQYPRPSFLPARNTISPALESIRIMGYTMRTQTQRYTEWVAYQPATFSANWSHVYATELYDYAKDPEGDYNVADVPAYSQVVAQLAQRLREGWRKALPAH